MTHDHPPGQLVTSPISACTRMGGQAMLEYLVLCAALGFALFFPIKDESSPDKPRTAVEIVANQFQNAYQSFSHSISLP